MYSKKLDVAFLNTVSNLKAGIIFLLSNKRYCLFLHLALELNAVSAKQKSVKLRQVY
jgi:hypothetical protein